MPNAAPAEAELATAGAWLTRHGLVDAHPTALLATRLAVRRRARLVANILLAALIIAAALVYTVGGRPGLRLLVLTAAVVGLVVARSLLDRWIRRVDQRAGATLRRRATLPVRLGWRTVLGLPHAAYTLATFAGAAVLAVGALTVPDATVRYGAAVVFIGLAGVGVGLAVQLRHLLAHPVVADDEVSLTADVIMRVDDARDAVVPTVVWSLPMVLLFGAALWLNVAAVAFVVLGVVALMLITARTAPSAAVARDVLGGTR